jgi:Ser/Thr protein kinase RdoA (MazF antagonist)
MSVSAVAEVLSRYAWAHAPRVECLGNRGGFSGATLWRVEDAAGAYCLKAWPQGVPPPRLAGIHSLLEPARAAGLDFVTRPLRTRDQSTVIEHAGAVWDLCTWLPGAADFHQEPTPRRLQAAGAALARLHHAWTPARPRRGPCPALTRRLECLADWQNLIAAGWRPQFPRDDPAQESAEQAWALLSRRVEAAVRELLHWQGRDVPLHPCWCDPWHDHLLFTGDRLTGLVDHGSVKEDHAAADLARMLGSLVGDNATQWRHGIEAYQAVRPLSDADIALASLLDRSGLVASAANWLRWLYHEHRAYVDRQAVAGRLRGIVERMTALPTGLASR